jgi:pimeloyl-ACP methyl ester carboxylesterase
MLQTEVQEIWLEVDGMRIHCLTAGESGSPVVLLHGGGIDSATLSWSDAIGPLSAHHRVFAPDLPGYGLSDTPDIQYTTDFYVNFVLHLLDTLHLEKVSLVGLSMGGGIALSFTLRFPDRVEKLVLVDSYGIIGADMWPRWVYLLLYFYVHRLSFLNELTYRYMGGSRNRVRRALAASGVVHREDRLSPRLVDQVYQYAHFPGRGKAFTSWQQSEFLWNGPRTNLVDRFHAIVAPTLVVNGEKDRDIPLTYAQKARERIAGSQLYVLKDCGHWPQREMPDEFNRVVGNFLDAING